MGCSLVGLAGVKRGLGDLYTQRAGVGRDLDDKSRSRPLQW